MPLDISTTLHDVGITCATGFAKEPRAQLAFVPPDMVATQVIEGSNLRTFVCLDMPKNAAAVATIVSANPMSAADESTIRVKLAEMRRIAAVTPTGSNRSIGLFDPAIVGIPLDTFTGDWRTIEGTTDSEAMFAQVWPVNGPIVGVAHALDKPDCRTMFPAKPGVTPVLPKWAPKSATLGDISTGRVCYDGPEPGPFVVIVRSNLTSLTELQLGAFVQSMVWNIGPTRALPPLVEPAPAVVATIDPPIAPSIDPIEPAAPVRDPDPDPEPAKPFLDHLRGLRLAGHHLSDADYGGSIGYRRAFLALAPVQPRIDVELGYNASAKMLADAQFALGKHGGDWEVGWALHAIVGVDVIGASQEMPRMANAVYYGGSFGLHAFEADVELAYLVRDDEMIDHEWRFELGYRTSSGHRVAGRVIRRGELGGTVLSISLEL